MATSPDATVLAAETRSVPLARRFVRSALAEAGAADWADVAELVVSELVTNAVVHAGTPVELAVWPTACGVRVEVADGSLRLPVARDHAATAGTGRGLHLVEQLCSRWGARVRDDGKVVWFELGAGDGHAPEGGPTAGAVAPTEEVAVELLHVPLLMHWAWQQHAPTLLREHLLAVIDEEPDALEQNAAAGEALDMLRVQVPQPDLPSDPAQLLVDAAAPDGMADRVVVRVPPARVHCFGALDRLLARAVAAAAAGELLAPPTQPEIAEMRQWLCEEVARQAAGGEPRPWSEVLGEHVLRLDGVPQPPHVVPERADDRVTGLLAGHRLGVVANEAGVILAVTPAVVELLGHRSEDDLVGHRLLAIIPERFRQAHVAGLTMNAATGRSVIVGHALTVPALRADGTEVPVGLHIGVRLLDEGRRLFIATLEVPEP